TSFVAAGFDTAGAVVGAAGPAVQASSSEASTAPPNSNALRRISVRRVNLDSERCVPGSEDSCDKALSSVLSLLAPSSALRAQQGRSVIEVKDWPDSRTPGRLTGEAL